MTDDSKPDLSIDVKLSSSGTQWVWRVMWDGMPMGAGFSKDEAAAWKDARTDREELLKTYGIEWGLSQP